MSGTNPGAKGRPAKVGHRKSRNGCIKCKARRVKCDEVRPTCGNCDRLRMDCAWSSRNLDAAPHHSTRARPTPSPIPPLQPSPSTKSGSTPTTFHSPDHGHAASFMTNWPRWPSDDDPFATSQLDDGQGISLPESKSRRMMEHRLMHHWHLNFGNNPSQALSPAATWRSLWLTQIPALAMTHDNVLFGMLAASATSLLRSGFDKDIFAVRQSYFISALHEQGQEVSKLCAENAEPVCFGALLVSICSFAMLKERNLEPYQPPLEWLQLGRGAGTVIWQSVEAIVTESRESNHPALMKVATTYPHFGKDQSYFDPSMRVNFSGVLTQHLPSGDDWSDPETREAYEKALSYVGSIQRGIDDGEPTYAVARRVQTFALLVPPKFVSLLSMMRPRALVILAHFWATVSQVHNVWWVGEADAVDPDSTAVREVRAIKGVLPKEWLATMLWPLDMVGLRDVEKERLD